MILLTGCLFLIPEKIPERARRMRRLRPVRGGARRGHWPAAARARGQARREATLSDDFAPLVRRLMARDQIPGVAVGVVERGHLVFARGFGYRDVDQRLPVTPDTLFPLGSCSKAFTATAIALLADEGRIALDAPVRAYLPDFALADPAASATLTIRDLLTHKSGLPRHDLFWYQAPFSRDELYRRLRFLEPSGPARTRWGYNSLMYVVAGRIVEKVSGESWERFVQARILLPLADASHPPFGGSDGGRPRSCLCLLAARRPRAKDTDADALERDRARGRRADERARSRPLAHVSRDEVARAARRRRVARAPSPASGDAGVGPARGAAALLRVGLDSRELPWPSLGGSRRGHRRVHRASRLSYPRPDKGSFSS